MQRGFGQEAEVAEHSTEFASRAALLAERLGQLFLADDLLLNQQLTQANSASPGHKVSGSAAFGGLGERRAGIGWLTADLFPLRIVVDDDGTQQNHQFRVHRSEE